MVRNDQKVWAFVALHFEAAYTSRKRKKICGLSIMLGACTCVVLVTSQIQSKMLDKLYSHTIIHTYYVFISQLFDYWCFQKAYNMSNIPTSRPYVYSLLYHNLFFQKTPKLTVVCCITNYTLIRSKVLTNCLFSLFENNLIWTSVATFR